MRIKIFIVLLNLLSFTFLFSQKTNEDSLLNRANEVYYNNPNESIRIIKELLKSEKDVDKIIKLYLVISSAELTKGNIEASLQYLYKAKELVLRSDDPKVQTSFFITSALQFEQMELDTKCLEAIDDAEKTIVKIPNDTYYKNFEVGRINLVKGMISKKKDNPEIALQQFLTAIYSFEKIKEVKKTYYNQNILYFYAGNCYFDLAQFENARAAFQKSKDFAVSTESNSLEAYAIKGLSQIEKQRHQNSNALKLLFEAEKKGQSTEDATLVEEIYKEMADNYLVLGNQNLYQDYTKKLQDLKYKREQLDISTVNESIDIHNAATISKLEQLKDEYRLKNIIIIFFGILISMLLLWKGIRVMKQNTKDTKEIQKILKS